MTQRIIKFRCWNYILKKMDYDPYALDEWTSETQPLNPVIESIQKDKRFSLMQFTGLHDKAGTPIYEGDILSTPIWGNVAVFYDTNNACFTLQGKAPYGLLLDTHVFEVIGNIYENQEFLKL